MQDKFDISCGLCIHAALAAFSVANLKIPIKAPSWIFSLPPSPSLYLHSHEKQL